MSIREEIISWAKDHYWDTLEQNRDLIINHLKQCPALEYETEKIEFTKTQRKAVQMCLDAYETEEWMSAGSVGINRLIEACDIIDRLMAENKNLERQLKAVEALLSLNEEVD